MLLADFDGVLAPLVADPETARADPACLDALAALAGRWTVGVVSGRSLDDLLPRLAPYEPDGAAGDHGLEIRLRGIRHWTHPQALRLRPRVLAAARDLGGTLESKRLTAKAYGAVPTAPPPPGVRFLAGRGGTDVLPDVTWDKGRAGEWLLDAWGWQPGGGAPERRAIYIGDEATDEEAFRRLAPRGVTTVRVAPRGPTAAALTLADQGAVATWLRGLAPES